MCFHVVLIGGSVINVFVQYHGGGVMRTEREFKQPGSVEAAPAMRIFSLAKIINVKSHFLLARDGPPCCVS